MSIRKTNKNAAERSAKKKPAVKRSAGSGSRATENKPGKTAERAPVKSKSRKNTSGKNRSGGKIAAEKGTAEKRSPDKMIVTINPSGRRESGFFELVFEIARQIPKGRVTSYGAIAACLGTRLSARMVGWAMNGAHAVKPRVPAHRVVNRNGMLTGRHHFATPDEMQELLEKEGIKVENDTVVDFKRLFWDPSTLI